MENNKNIDCIGSSFSMRKIPVSSVCSDTEKIDDDCIDKIKILELSNIIDAWEKELLFSDDGFFSLKGKEVKDKSKDFISELESFINSKITEMSFVKSNSFDIAKQIKKDKISAIKREMEDYEKQQFNSWELSVFENAVSSSINRAVLYKSNPNITVSSFKNGLSVIKIMSEKEKWSQKTYKSKLESYKSVFYYSLIEAFIQDKDVKAFTYFNKFKDFLLVDDKEKLEEVVKQLKIDVVSFNWAKELFSYNLDKDEQEVEINKIKDDEIEKQVRKYLSDFSKSKEKERQEIEKNKNTENWQELIKISNEDIDKAYLYIDYSLKSESTKHKKDYIGKVKKNGCITTDKKEFINLLTEFFDDFEKFKIKDIADFQSCLDKDDFEFFLQLQKTENSKFHQMKLDYKYILEKFNSSKMKKIDKYDFVKSLIIANEEYKTINKKEADLENRSKIIDTITKRFEQNKKEGEDNDGIINSTRK